MRGSYAGLIKQLYRKSHLQVNEYADAIGYSTVQVSNVLNDKQPGSHKMLQAALEFAGISIDDLAIPGDDGAMANQERELLRLFRLLSDEQRTLALQLCRALCLSERSLKKKGRGRDGSR